MALLQLPHQVWDQPLQHLSGRFGMRCRLLEPKRCTGRQLRRDRGQRFGLAAEHAVECLDDVFGSAEPPCQCEPRDIDQRADRLEPQPLERAHCVRVEAERGNVKR